MPDFQFERQCRTPSSEIYRIIEDGQPNGRVDLHFASDVVYGTLAVRPGLPEEDLLDLIEQIDEDLVLSAEVNREDFIVTVLHGEEVGIYTDDSFDEDEVYEEEDKISNNDHR